MLSKQSGIQAARGQRKWFHEVDDEWLPLMGEVSDKHIVLVWWEISCWLDDVL